MSSREECKECYFANTVACEDCSVVGLGNFDPVAGKAKLFGDPARQSRQQKRRVEEPMTECPQAGMNREPIAKAIEDCIDDSLHKLWIELKETTQELIDQVTELTYNYKIDEQVELSLIKHIKFAWADIFNYRYHDIVAELNAKTYDSVVGWLKNYADRINEYAEKEVSNEDSV